MNLLKGVVFISTKMSFTELEKTLETLYNRSFPKKPKPEELSEMFKKLHETMDSMVEFGKGESK